ncbi:MAG TPA: 4-(cytidine 5'-diphospho)-2-C-methyl-D-erythritol kinase [Acidobacteriaceae bacterium]|jgi:4-diphosphocytidyl-2-C-methyl-D-erythritol kinase|nr:4-(cytidine 5'-diphospho)-2-C-methyl-D-erythritol kinase [Acidobacteriaceae bacterium]
MSVTLRSFAKINLGLAIGLARPDGYHALATVYQTIALHDLVTVTARRAAATRLTLTSNDERVPTDARNTAWKMAERALAVIGVKAEVEIHIEKRLPVQGGLGAGSANAAAALLGLERELGTELSKDNGLRVAAEVGSDVPLFLLGGAVLGLGRGEVVSPLPDLPAIPCVVALPEVGVSTPAAFREWDARHSALTPEASADRLEVLSRSVSAAWSQPHSSGVSRAASSEGIFEGNSAQRGDLAETPLLALVRTGMANDFEEVVFAQYPSLADIVRVLHVPGQSGSDQSEGGAIYAALSGSGSALFGLYATARAADRAAGRLRDRGIVALRTETLPREQYWRTMWVD